MNDVIFVAVKSGLEVELLLASKLTRPTPPAACVDRPRLYRELDRWKSVRAVVVQAAAGYGKSALVSRWIEVSDHAAQVAWLALDDTDCDPSQFVVYVAAALDPVVPGALALVQPILEDTQGDARKALKRLLAALQTDVTSTGSAPDPHRLLVLDDLHLVQSAAVDALIMAMLERGPANLHLLLVARQATSLPLARLVAGEQILELTSDDLRFTADEVPQFSMKHGFPELTGTELAELLARTEGWIAALQLAAISQRKRGSLQDLLSTLRGDKRWLAQYLTTEVLAQQTPAMRRFLLQTSILDAFNASLCEAVTGAGSAYQLLSEIEQADLFLIPLDSRHDWFRYHHLFQELLQHRLQETEGSADVSDLHRRAAAWLAGAERIQEAVRHLLAAGDDDAAVALIENRMHAAIQRDPYQAQRLLNLLPQQMLVHRPRLLLDRCRLSILFNSKHVPAHVQQAEQALVQQGISRSDAPALHAELLVHRAIAQFRQGAATAAAELAEQAQRCEHDLDAFMMGTLEFLSMHLRRAQGMVAAAQRHAERALLAFRAADFVPGIVALHRESAWLAVRTGRSEEAALQFQAIFAGEGRDRPMVMRELLFTYFYAAENSYWQNSLDQAQAYQQAAMALALRLQDDEIIHFMARLGQLYAAVESKMYSSAHDSSTIPVHFTAEISAVLADVEIRLLIATNRRDEAWTIAQGLDLDLGGEPENVLNRGLIPFLRAYIARGSDLEAVTPLLSRALAHRMEIEDRFNQLQLLALIAWQELRRNCELAALRTLTQAARLALETGYVRAMLDIPELAALLERVEDPDVRAAGLFQSTGVHLQREIGLTAQEASVLKLLAADCTYRQIAGELVISINTVRTHVRHLYKKLGVHQRAQALERARFAGLLKTES